MAPFSLVQIQSPETEMTDLIKRLIPSFRNPPNTFLELLFAEESFNSYNAAIENYVERQVAGLQDNATWLKVVDEASGQIAGAACWRIFDDNPYQQNRVPVKCSWWPEGPVHDLTCLWIEALLKSRHEFMAKPHVCTLNLDLLEHGFRNPID
jgi:hypothetical protein